MIIFLYGADDFRSHRFLLETKNKFIKEIDTDAHSLTTLDGSICDLQTIDKQVNTGSLFVRKRLVIIENLFKNKKTQIFTNLLSYLPKVATLENLIIIIRDGDLSNSKNLIKGDVKKLFLWLNKQKFAQEFKPLTGSALINFIKQEAAFYQKNIDEKAVSEIIKRTTGDLWIISKEIKKAAFMTSEKIITINDIKILSQEIFNENIFALTDAISTRNKSLALKILEEQYAAGVSDEYLLTMLTRQFKLLLQIKNYCLNNSALNVASDLKIHPFVAKKSLSQIKNFTEETLLFYFNSLIKLDKINKTSQAEVKTQLTILLAQI